ncbi:hypothetical protein A8D63_19415, partial [Burkholderia cenocepacia]
MIVACPAADRFAQEDAHEPCPCRRSPVPRSRRPVAAARACAGDPPMTWPNAWRVSALFVREWVGRPA